MSQAEELLNSLSEEVPVHTHPVPDTDTYFIIDPITRTIENTNRKKTVIMQYDHNSERFTFELPRYVDGHDMLECTSVTVNVDNIEAETGTTNSDAPDMTDLRLHPNDPEKVISSWIIKRNSTQLAGKLSFHIEYKCADSNGNVVYEWSTDTYDEIEVKARKKNGEAAVIEHTDLLEQWRTRIFGAGDSVMADIAAEGTAQVAAVKAESETQQEAVELKGAQTLDSIPEDYTEVDAMADEAVRTKSDAIVCETAGEYIKIQDSSDDHIRGLKLFGRSTQVTTTGAQLANLPDGKIELGGIVWTCSGGVVTAVGTCNAESSSTGNSIYYDLTGLSGTFYVSGNSEPARVYVRVRENGTEKWYNNISFTLTGTEESVLFYIQVANVGTVVNTTLYPMLNRGDTALPWEPYSGGLASPNPDWSQELESVENPKLNIYGKNIIPNLLTRTDGPVSFTANSDGSFTVNGTADTYRVGTSDTIDATPYRGKTVTLSGKTTFGNGLAMQIFSRCKSGNDFSSITNGRAVTFKIPEDAETIALQCYVTNNMTADNVTVYPQLELGSVETEWEPYKPIQTIAIQRSIPGIPVTTGGNYTDENGQQWICDEIDFERGIHIQRITEYIVPEQKADDLERQTNYDGDGYYGWFVRDDKVKDFGNNRNDNPGYSTHFVATNHSNPSAANQFRIWGAVGCLYFTLNTNDAEIAANIINSAMFYLALETPIETPLTAEEIAAFKALRTNCPNTTILNDAGAWMSVKYNADTKTYVDKPKILKLVDSSTGVVYELKVVDGNLTVTPIE